LLIVAHPPAARAAERLCDTSFQDCRAPLLTLIANEHARIDVAFDMMEDDVIADALIKRFKAGLPVRVLMDPRRNAVSSRNAAVLQKLAAAGIPTLIEKPLATDASESQQLVDAFEGAGLVNAVGHVERCNPALLALRERLDHGDLGEIYQVATRRQGPFPHRIADVGVVKDLATHDIDLTAWVIRSQYRSVSAHSAHKSGRTHEDLISITAQMEDGTVVSHLVNWLSPLKERVTVVTGERGAFVADTLTGDLTFHENGLIRTEWEQVSTFRGVTEANSTRFAIPKPEPLRVQHEHFRDAVLGTSAKVVTMREGLRTVAVADACLRSSQEGRTVEVSEVLA